MTSDQNAERTAQIEKERLAAIDHMLDNMDAMEGHINPERIRKRMVNITPKQSLEGLNIPKMYYGQALKQVKKGNKIVSISNGCTQLTMPPTHIATLTLLTPNGDIITEEVHYTPPNKKTSWLYNNDDTPDH